MLMAACGGSGSETPPPVEPTTPRAVGEEPPEPAKTAEPKSEDQDEPAPDEADGDDPEATEE